MDEGSHGVAIEVDAERGKVEELKLEGWRYSSMSLDACREKFISSGMGNSRRSAVRSVSVLV